MEGDEDDPDASPRANGASGPSRPLGVAGESSSSDAVEVAVRRLLSATRDFTRAYEAWAVSPRSDKPEKETVLEAAERRLELARNEVIAAQLRKH